jgi:FeS assembly SUF system protein
MTPNELREEIIRVLRKVRDPEIPVNIYDLGLIYNLDIDETGFVSIRMTLTAPNCPVAGILPAEVESRVKNVVGVTGVKLELVFDPPWSKSRMSDAAKLAMGVEDVIPIPGGSRQ